MDSKRAAIIHCYSAGDRPSEIIRRLRIPRTTVYDAIKRFHERGDALDRPRCGRPRSVNTTRTRNIIRNRIRRNPRISMRKLSKCLGVAHDEARRISRTELGLHAYKLHKAQHLTEKMMSTRLTRCQQLKQRFAKFAHREILFSDEKPFTIEQSYNPQNDRIWATEAPGASAIVTRSQKAASVMAWAGVTATGKTPLIFIESGVKINQEVYRKTILENVVLPWTKNHFGKAKWTFQQDSAPSHRAKATQEWCKTHFPHLITAGEWPPYSPDLNPLDYSIWSILEAKACCKPHTSIEALKTSLRAAWHNISTETLRIVIDDFPARLDACIKARGGHFEFA